ncbi:MAG: hypothetical protein GY806_06455 [Gammaproteobacteria bacterium]|nr:hypothetical protein [Gammaproteobacteria bacterium]
MNRLSVVGLTGLFACWVENFYLFVCHLDGDSLLILKRFAIVQHRPGDADGLIRQCDNGSPLTSALDE